MEGNTRVIDILGDNRIIAVLTIEDAEAAVPLAKALLDGGVGAMELTLRTPAAIAALEAIIQKVPEMVAGVGTVLTPDQIRQVARIGAAFAVAPGLNPSTVRAARNAGVPFAPGIATPSDIEAAVELGCRVLKFFPAQTMGGVAYLKSMSGPYRHLGLQFVPLGGISLENMLDYLRQPNVCAVGGSFLARKDTIKAQDWDAVRHTAAEATELLNDL